jgi:hypothetical protein
MTLAGERRLQVRQRDSVGKDPLGDCPAKLAQAGTGHYGHGEPTVGRHAGRSIGQVGLGSHHHRRPLGHDGPLVFARLPAGLDAEQHEVRRGEIAPADLDTHAVDPVGRVPQPGGIDQSHRPVEKVGVGFDRVPGGPRDLGDQRPVSAEQRVEE